MLLLDALTGRGAAEIVDAFMAMWRAALERSGFTAGCSVLAVTVSADSRELLARARQDIGPLEAVHRQLRTLAETNGAG